MNGKNVKMKEQSSSSGVIKDTEMVMSSFSHQEDQDENEVLDGLDRGVCVISICVITA